MPSRQTALRLLALSLKDGPWTKAALRNRIVRALGEKSLDAQGLAARLVFVHDEGRSPSLEALRHTLGADPALATLWADPQAADIEVRVLLDPPVMQPPAAEILRLIRLPELPTVGDLAAWLGLDPPQLDWLCDQQRRQAAVTAPRLCHYRYQWRERPGRTPRLIEAPKSRLKAIQRRILREILDRVPVHPAAHGFRRRRSCLSHAEQHLGQEAVLRLDISDFFPSVGIARVRGLFRALGYPPPVALSLAGLCTHAASPALLGEGLSRLDWHQRKRIASVHLPQGAPSSPAIANLCAWRLDCRLTALAKRLGLIYTRYADDLAFSGGRTLARRSNGLHALIGSICAEEGFSLNFRKTRLMTAAQRQMLTGILVNRRPNCLREDYDRLKATLFNCVRHGPASQNRAGIPDFKGHLRGRIAHVVSLNPERGRRLRTLFEAIEWDQRAEKPR